MVSFHGLTNIFFRESLLHGRWAFQDIRRMSSSLLRDKAYINGEWVSGNNSFSINNPANGKVIAAVADLNSVQIQEAISAAHEAFQTWRWTTAKERSNLLRNWYNICVANQKELAALLTSEQGKPLAEAQGEITYGLGFLEWFAEEARRINGEVVPSPSSSKQMVFMRQPVGVAAMITPWNFPNAMITRKVGAALACGCTVVVKPAEETPLSALALAALAEEAGIPKGVLNIVTAKEPSMIGRILCASEKVAALSFTGSTNVGKLLYAQCAGSVKKLSLELGGNAPFLVFDSADVDLAVAGCMTSKFRNSGQTCVSTNRVLVQDGIYDKFIMALRTAMNNTLIVGDGMESGVNQGPLINQNQFGRIKKLVDDTLKQGAKVVLGGMPHEKGGLFFQPTILTDVEEDMECFKQEIFGPVLAIKKFKTEEEAIAIANNTNLGLAGYFYSNDVRQCWRVGQKLEVGMVGINEGLISAVEAAFGGIKESGLGREGSHHGIEEYTEIKYMCFGSLL